jgi:hypothetical protein
MDAVKSSDPKLHVFEQDGEWHWGITIDRPTGIGVKVVAFSDDGFGSEEEAREDGERAMREGEWKSQASRRAEPSRSSV